MAMNRRFVYEHGGLLMIYETHPPKIRMLNLKTGEARETDNTAMMEKVKNLGEEVPASQGNY